MARFDFVDRFSVKIMLGFDDNEELMKGNFTRKVQGKYGC
jgi:hypothetical protein